MGLVAGRDLVVVLSYRGRADTLECVESLVEGNASLSVLVVDNGGYDGTLDEIALRWPWVSRLQLTANQGFAGGMNRGIEWGLREGARSITVLNNDTVIPCGALERLASACQDGEAVSPVVLDSDGGLWFGGGTVDAATRLARHLSGPELDEAGVSEPRYGTEVLSGCCVVATSATWSSVGLFDERFFLNFEDSEWSLRARSRGVALLVDRRVEIVHKVSRTFTTMGALGMYYYARNGLLFSHCMEGTRGAHRARFLRRHVIPVVACEFRSGRVLDGARRVVVLVAAVASYRLGVYGRAPRWIERISVTGRRRTS